MRWNFRNDPIRYGIFGSAVLMAILLLSIEFAWLTSRNEIRAARTVALPAARAAADLVPASADPEPAPIDTTVPAVAPTTMPPVAATELPGLNPPATVPTPTTAPPAVVHAAVLPGIGRKD